MRPLALVAACLAAWSARGSCTGQDLSQVRKHEVIAVHVGKTCGGSVINYMRNRMPVSEIHLRPVLPDDLKTAPLVVVVVRDPVDRVISAFNWDSPWGGRPKQAKNRLPSSKARSAYVDIYDCFATAGKFADAVGAFAARSKDEKRKQTKKRSCEWLATAFLKQDNGQALGAPIVDLNRATAFHDAKELARVHKGCPDAPHCPVFSCHGHLSRGASWYLSNGKTRDALKKKKFWMVHTANCANDTIDAIEWLSLHGGAVKEDSHHPNFSTEHVESEYHHDTQKELDAVLERKLPADSTDKRVVRRRAVLAAALDYEYEQLNWLAEHAINYRVDGGVPVPKFRWER